jgi:hypothetical protein
MECKRLAKRRVRGRGIKRLALTENAMMKADLVNVGENYYTEHRR